MASGATDRIAGRDVVLRCAVLAAAYFVAAKLGLSLAYSNENITSVWPPTGIAIAALLLLGPRVWPGITAGALLANLSNGAGIVTSLAFCVGNTLAPVVGAMLLRRTGFRTSLDRLRDVLALVLLAGGSMLISATGGTATLAATDAIGRDGAGLAWLVWWVGDALGVILFAPILLTFATPPPGPDPIRERPREAALLATAAAVGAVVVFGTKIPLAHLIYPFAIWAALRFYQRGASAMTVLLSAIAIVFTVGGDGPFSGMSRTTNLLSLQAFNGSIGLAALSLAAVTLERRAAQDALRRSADVLEERVATRTKELAASEALMRDTAERLRVLDEFKDSLLTAVSHELRTPLTVIMGLATTLTDPTVSIGDEERADLIERLQANAMRLDRLLADLLDVDRLNRDVIQPRPRATPLAPAVRRALEGLDLKGHDVRIDVGSAVVAADTAHLERIIENLLSNAVKHTPEGTSIRVTSDVRADGVVLVVEDSGPGVPAALRELIFEPFRRGDGSSHVQGTGVGLSLVARFARVNGGRAWVEERTGGGASFRVLLPHANGHDGGDAASDTEPAAAHESPRNA